VIAAIFGLPSTALGAAMLFMKLAPELRDAIVALIKALQDGDDDEARRAYEAARRVAFMARQKR
jgi:hypothetical protein